MQKQQERIRIDPLQFYVRHNFFVVTKQQKEFIEKSLKDFFIKKYYIINNATILSRVLRKAECGDLTKKDLEDYYLAILDFWEFKTKFIKLTEAITF